MSAISLRRLVAVARKESLHIVRDPRSLFLVTASPAFLLFMLAYIFAFEVTQVNLAVMDLDRSQESRRYVALLAAAPDVRLDQRVSGYAEIEPLLVRGTIDAALVVPPGFAADLARGRPAQVQLVLDGSDPFSASQVMSTIGSQSSAFALELGAAGLDLAPQPLDISTQSRYNAGSRSLFSMVPALLAIVLIMPTLSIALALAREKETGTLEGLLATPISGLEYILGKLLAYLAAGEVAALLALVLAVTWFEVPFRGSLSVFFLLTADYFLACMGAAVVITNFVKSQQSALFVVLMLFLVPSFFLAGLISPVGAGSLTSVLMPSTHFMEISRAVFLKGLGLAHLQRPALVLLGMGLGALAAGLSSFHKKLA